MSEELRVVPNKERLPRGWALASCKELFSFVTSGSRGWAQFYSSDGAPFIRIGDLSRGTLTVSWPTAQRVAPPETTEGTRTRLHPGDVLVSITADLGVVGVMPAGAPNSYVNQHVALARPSQEVEPRFIGWFLDAEPGGQRQFRELRRGATKAGLGLDDIRSVVVPIAPLAEQRRIVAEIEKQFTRLDAAVATLTAVQAKLKRARASVLKAAVEGRLVPTEAELARAEGRSYEPASALLERILAERRARWPKGKKYQPPAEPKTVDLPAVPEGWAWASLPQLGELDRGRSRHRPRNDARLLGGPYPFIQTGDVRSSSGTIRSYATSYSEFGLAQSRLWPAGTLCITIAANIAETGVLLFDACFPDSVVGFLGTCSPSLVRFIEFFLRTQRRQLEALAPATAQRNINLATLRSLPVPVPPLAEQARIVAEVERRLSVIDTLEHTVEQSLTRCGRLRQSILKRAFEGKLVPQDPSDEPASELLARIRAQRTAKARA